MLPRVHSYPAWSDKWYFCVLWTVILLYGLLGLAIVCDDYFMTSLEMVTALLAPPPLPLVDRHISPTMHAGPPARVTPQISEALNLSDDVAGATFMAAGSSAPELFTSVMDTFIFTSNVGVGTIVGSAVFNILVIIAVSAAASKQVTRLVCIRLAGGHAHSS